MCSEILTAAEPPPTFSLQTFQTATGGQIASESYSIDFDSDGDLDLILSPGAFATWPPTYVKLRALRNTGRGLFEDATDQVLGEVKIVLARDVRIADFNRDGRMDLALADHGTDTPPFPGGQSRILMQTEDGRLRDETPSRLPLVDAFTHHLSTGDIDGDGDEDLYFCNSHNSGEVVPRLYLNDGRGVFTQGYLGEAKNFQPLHSPNWRPTAHPQGQYHNPRLPLEITTWRHNYTSSLFVDVDRDGDLDLVLGYDGTPLKQTPRQPRDTLLLNDGQGYFTFAPVDSLPARSLGVDSGNIHIASEDLDLDGWPDLIMVLQLRYSEPALQLLLNNRDGTFRDASIRIPQAWTPGPDASWVGHWVAFARIADLNQDGLPDFIVTQQHGPAKMYINQGGAVFVDASASLPLPARNVSILAGDFNGDGRIDVQSHNYSGEQYLALNKAGPTRPGFDAAKRDQAIVFPPLKNTALTAPSITLEAKASSGLPIHFSVVSGPASVTGKRLDPQGPGEVVVRAEQPGDANFNPALRVDRAIRVYPAGPTVIRPPRSQIVVEGGRVVLDVGAQGAPPWSYQWRREEEDIPGAREPELVLDPARMEHDGRYTVRIMNAAGSTTSTSMELRVSPLLRGKIRREWYRSIPGVSVTDFRPSEKYPQSPDRVDFLEALESKSIGSAYGVRLSGFLTPPANGDYVFYIASNDHSELRVSTDESPQNLLLIAWDVWRESRDWTQAKLPDGSPRENRSAPIRLEFGKLYYFEILHKNSNGQDHVAVTWKNATAPDPVPGSAPIGAGALSCPSFTDAPQPPLVVEPPFSQFPRPLGSAVFSIVVAGQAPFEFQWRLEGTNLPGATNRTLKIGDVSAEQAGRYDVVARNFSGSVTSAPAMLVPSERHVVGGQLRRELYRNIPGDTVASLSRHARFLFEPDAVDTVKSAEHRNLGEQFGARIYGFVVPPVSGAYEFYIASDDQSQLFLSTDADPARKSLVAFEPQWNSERDWTGLERRNPTRPENRSIPISLQAGRLYYIEILHKEDRSGDYLGVTWRKPGDAPPAKGSAPLEGASIAYTLFPPSVVSQPGDREIVLGESFSLQPTVVGSPPFRFQWRLNGVSLPGETNRTFSRSSIAVSDLGRYSLVIANEAGTVFSEEASVRLAKRSQSISFPPIPDQYPRPTPLRLEGNATSGLPVVYEIISGNATVASDLLTLRGAGTVEIIARQPGSEVFATAEPVTRKFQVLPPQPSLLSHPLSLSVNEGQAAKFQVVASGAPPLQFQWRIGASDIPGANEPELNFLSVRPADAGEYSVVVKNEFGSIVSRVGKLEVSTSPVTPGKVRREIYRGIPGDAVSALQSHERFQHTPSQVDFLSSLESKDLGDAYGIRVLGLITPPVSGEYVFYIASDDQSQFYLSTDETPTRKVLLASEPQWNNSRDWVGVARRTPSRPQNRSNPVALTAGQPYYFEILHKDGGGGDHVAVTWQKPGDPIPANGQLPISTSALSYRHFGPHLLLQPSSLDRAAGAAATFQVRATGSAPLTYQWIKDELLIPGATNATLALTQLNASSAGVYAVRVTGPGSSVLSSSASLTVPGKAQVVMFQPLLDRRHGDPPFQLKATASSGLPVQFRVTSGPAKVEGSVLSLHGAGRIVIRASQPGDAVYSPARDVEQSFFVPSALLLETISVKNDFRFSFVGEFGKSYLIQRSEDLQVWTTWISRLAEWGAIEVVDEFAPASTRRFYRVVPLE